MKFTVNKLNASEIHIYEHNVTECIPKYRLSQRIIDSLNLPFLLAVAMHAYTE